MILTSNRGFAEWGEIFGDAVVATALLDRLLHHAVVIQIEGSRYRLRQHGDLVPEHLRAKTVAVPSPAPKRRARLSENSTDDHQKADHRPVPNPSTRENWTPTIGETSVPVDSTSCPQDSAASGTSVSWPMPAEPPSFQPSVPLCRRPSPL